jgi:hypothetical protein
MSVLLSPILGAVVTVLTGKAWQLFEVDKIFNRKVSYISIGSDLISDVKFIIATIAVNLIFETFAKVITKREECPEIEKDGEKESDVTIVKCAYPNLYRVISCFAPVVSVFGAAILLNKYYEATNSPYKVI